VEWKVKYVNLSQEFKLLEQEILKEIKRIMSTGEFILRKDVEDLEDNLGKYLNVKNVIGVNSGTDALYLSAKGLGMKKGDEVITVAHSFVATLATIVHQKAKPVLVDIKEDFNINEDKIEEAITNKTRFIIPVHLNGRTCEMNKITEIAKKYNLRIIEDSAQSLGSRFNGTLSGTFDVGCFSFHPMKSLGCAGDGGFVSTNDDNLAEKVRLLRNHGQKSKTDIIRFGYSSRLDNLQAAILNIKLRYFPEWIKKRREIASRYSNELKRLPLTLPPPPSEEKHFDTFNSYVIRCDSSLRDELNLFLRNKKLIESFVHISKPLYKYKELEIHSKPLQINEKLCQEIISLPIHPHLKEEEVDYTISSLNEFFENRK